MDNRYVCILAGGRGERFWPMSTHEHPKQVLALASEKPMLREAVDRITGLVPPERVLVITSAALAEVCRSAIPHVPPENVIGEPCGRDTAAACALAAAIVAKRSPDGMIAMLTADHVIQQADRFCQILEAAFTYASRESVIITLGIKPEYPSTGFGYIACADDRKEAGGVVFRKAERFVEKPDLETAKTYVRSGNYLWNGGMFVWQAHTLFAALGQYAPELRDMAQTLQEAAETPAFADVLRAAYAAIGRISIDYAVMEKADNIITAESDFGWMDVGTWASMDKLHEPDASGNRVLGAVEALDSRDNFVWSEGRLTAMIGVTDLVVVHTDKATLVCPKSRAENVKQLVQQIAARADGANWL